MIINTEGIISIRPIWIKKVRFLRAAYDDAATFTWWDEGETPDHTVATKETTFATATFTSTGNFASGAPAVNDIIYFYKTSTGNNKFRVQTGTAGDNDDAIVDALNSYHGTFTDEATKTYSWKIWTPKIAFSFEAGLDVDAEQITEVINFGDRGVRFNNLAMHTLSSSATAEIYVR